MSSFQLDETGDLALINNALSFTTGLEAIRQHLQVKFRTFLGEWFADTSVGTPWYQEIFLKGAIFAVVQERLKAIILETPGVIALLRFKFDFDPGTREAEFDFDAQTTDGIIDFSQIIEV